MSYFKPWRRKLGVVTLVMACLFMAGWVRSLVIDDYITIQDFVEIPTENFVMTGLATKPHYLQLLRPPSQKALDVPMPQLEVADNQLSEPHALNESGSDKEIVGGGSVSFGQMLIVCFPRDEPFAEIPYWLCVLPLTLLSAWLLLSKPRVLMKP